MKCPDCRSKDAEFLTSWERCRYWLFVRFNSVLFPQDYEDMKGDRYTQGFSDGTVQGYERGSLETKAMISKYGF